VREILPSAREIARERLQVRQIISPASSGRDDEAEWCPVVLAVSSKKAKSSRIGTGVEHDALFSIRFPR